MASSAREPAAQPLHQRLRRNAQGRPIIGTANDVLGEQGARERGVPPGQYVCLCVTDTGTGMAPEVIANAFEPFSPRRLISLLHDIYCRGGPAMTHVVCLGCQAANRVPQARLLKVDTEVGQATSAALGIRSIPALVLFRSDREVARQSGGLSAGQIAQWEARPS